jgi:hypothetical protein
MAASKYVVELMLPSSRSSVVEIRFTMKPDAMQAGLALLPANQARWSLSAVQKLFL